jgi:hypothetical protein
MRGSQGISFAVMMLLLGEPRKTGFAGYDIRADERGHDAAPNKTVIARLFDRATQYPELPCCGIPDHALYISQALSHLCIEVCFGGRSRIEW